MPRFQMTKFARSILRAKVVEIGFQSRHCQFGEMDDAAFKYRISAILTLCHGQRGHPFKCP